MSSCCIYIAAFADYTASLGRICHNQAVQRAHAVKVDSTDFTTSFSKTVVKSVVFFGKYNMGNIEADF